MLTLAEITTFEEAEAAYLAAMRHRSISETDAIKRDPEPKENDDEQLLHAKAAYKLYKKFENSPEGRAVMNSRFKRRP